MPVELAIFFCLLGALLALLDALSGVVTRRIAAYHSRGRVACAIPGGANVALAVLCESLDERTLDAVAALGEVSHATFFVRSISTEREREVASAIVAAGNEIGIYASRESAEHAPPDLVGTRGALRSALEDAIRAPGVVPQPFVWWHPSYTHSQTTWAWIGRAPDLEFRPCFGPAVLPYSTQWIPGPLATYAAPLLALLVPIFTLRGGILTLYTGPCLAPLIRSSAARKRFCTLSGAWAVRA